MAQNLRPQLIPKEPLRGKAVVLSVELQGLNYCVSAEACSLAFSEGGNYGDLTTARPPKLATRRLAKAETMGTKNPTYYLPGIEQRTGAGSVTDPPELATW